MGMVADDPATPLSQERNELCRGIRSFHVRHARSVSKSRVASPVHVIFYRVVEPGVIEILRVLHQRMDPGQHLAE